jgi:hypothetical protein
MRYCLGLDMLQQKLHGRIVREAAILHVKSEMGWVQLKNKRRRCLAVLLQHVCRGFHYVDRVSKEYQRKFSDKGLLNIP